MEGDDGAPKPTKMEDTTFQARSALKGAGMWLSNVGKRAKDAALVAGQHLDKAAISVGTRVEQVSQQIGDAYEQRVARDAAAKCEARKLHRQALEADYDEPAREAALTQGSDVIQECLNFAGEVQQEIQYADASSPLGRESYGLMMFVNTLVPLLEHGMRPDWKAVTPSEPVAEASAWARNMPYTHRNPTPSAFSLLLAAEHGWRGQAPTTLGAAVFENSADVTLPQRRVQAWIFQSLSDGCLAQRLTALLTHAQLLSDFFYPWAAVLQLDTMNLLIEELVLIESRTGLIHLPIDHLFDHTRDAQGAVPLAERVKGGLAIATDFAGRASKAVLTKASEVSERVNDSVRNYRAGSSAASTGLPRESAVDQSHDFGPSSPLVISPQAPREPSTAFSAAATHSSDGLTVHVNEAYTNDGRGAAAFEVGPDGADPFAMDSHGADQFAIDDGEAPLRPSVHAHEEVSAADVQLAGEAAPALPPDLMFPSAEDGPPPAASDPGPAGARLQTDSTPF